VQGSALARAQKTYTSVDPKQKEISSAEYCIKKWDKGGTSDGQILFYRPKDSTGAEAEDQ